MGTNRKNAKVRREVRRQLRSTNRLDSEQTNNIVNLQDYSVTKPTPTRDTRPIKPYNEQQRVYIKAINSKSIIFATGSAGTGKTFLSTALAAEALINKDIERIIVTRPVLSAEEDLGFLPGDMHDKFAPYFRPVYDVLRKRLGAGFLQYCLKPEIGKVEIAPFAYMRGRTFENAIVILDEAQNVTVGQMKMFLTRIGENTTVIVNGDIDQIDLPVDVQSGLCDALERFTCTSDVEVVKFKDSDCVRSEVCRIALRAYNSNVEDY